MGGALAAPSTAPRDFNDFLAELRTTALATVTPGASTVLSAGPSSAWYFDWIAQNFSWPVARHIGVEFFAPAPASLREGAEWIAGSVEAFPTVKDGEVDLVIAGQLIEHLWPEELAGFLAESRRVLAPGGRILVDSPNRWVTESTGWTHPEHTVEFTVHEMIALLRLAGFDEFTTRGLWLCYDRDSHRMLPLPVADTPGWPVDRRVKMADSRPEDSFIWWLEGRSGAAPPDAEAVKTLAATLYQRFRARRLCDFSHTVGQESSRHEMPVIATSQGEAGYLLYGPYLPLLPGSHVVSFFVGVPEPSETATGDVLATIDVASQATPQGESALVAQRALVRSDFQPDRELVRVDLPFTLSGRGFGVQFRLLGTGRSPLVARRGVELFENDNSSR